MSNKKTDIDRKRSDKSKIFLDDKLQENKILRKLLRDRLKISDKEIDSYIKTRKEILIPISVFSNKISTLENVTAYLKDIEGLTHTQIADLLKRDVKTIWSAYNRAEKKKVKLDLSDSYIEIPAKIFSDRRFSMLESLVHYLHVDCALRFSDIARLLTLDQSTVWTVNKRYNTKND